MDPTREDLERDLAADLAYVGSYGMVQVNHQGPWAAAIRRALASEPKALKYDELMGIILSMAPHDTERIHRMEATLDWMEKAKVAEAKAEKLDQLRDLAENLGATVDTWVGKAKSAEARVALLEECLRRFECDPATITPEEASAVYEQWQADWDRAGKDGADAHNFRERVAQLEAMISQYETISPCACCGTKLAWIFLGDATISREVLTGAKHVCPVSQEDYAARIFPPGTYAHAERRAAAAEARVAELLAAIRQHMNERGDDRCTADDGRLYAVLPEGDTRPERETLVTIENCMRYIECRQTGREYVSPQREIERLESRVKELEEVLSKVKEAVRAGA